MTANLRTLLKFSPFKVGCLVVFCAALLFSLVSNPKPQLLSALDHRLTDTMFSWRGPIPTSGEVVIVDIDEKSLREIGQWPWSRNVVAELVKIIAAQSPRALGLDIVFAERDRTSPRNFVEELDRLPNLEISGEALRRFRESPGLDYDLTLGQALANSPSVLGYVFQLENDGLKNSLEVPFPSSIIHLSPAGAEYDEIQLHSAYRATVNIEAVSQAETEGFFNVFPDSSGTVRRVPLIMEMDGVPYPSLALEMVRIGMGLPELTIHASQVIRKNRGILGVSLGNRFIPTDEKGRLNVNFRGPVRTFPYLSAVDLLKGKSPGGLRDKYVLIGTSAAGLLDLRTTPFSSVVPGVEVQANIIDNILQGDPFTHDSYTEIALTMMVIILVGLALSALLAYSSPLAGGVAGLLAINAIVAGNYLFFFRNHEFMGMSYPLMTLLAVFLLVTLFNFFFEGREKKFISTAFGRYVSPQVVQQLRKDPGKLTLSGEQKNLTVLFSDIRGFTTISEKINSQELGRFMNEYLTAMSNVVMNRRGTVDKFIGDAVMAIWGAPLDDEDHAANGVRAAFAMLETLAALRPAWEKKELPFIDIGVGINTGIMSVGNFGSERRFDFTVMGDNVNLASRLEGSNKTYGTNIIISEFTREAIGPRFFCRFLDMVRVKGKHQPVKIYEPVCEGEPSPEVRREVEQFEEAVRLYRKLELDAAEGILLDLNLKRPARLYGLYLERISIFRQTPPPENWDGAFTFTTK